MIRSLSHTKPPGNFSNVISIFLALVVCFTLSMRVNAGAITLDQALLSKAERTDLSIEIAKGESDPETFIPLSIITGAKKGPVVLMVAGVHGFEFAPILAAERLADEVDANELAGTLMIVRLAHVSSFEARTPYVNPYDRKNLNRSFPGSATGTQTERIAHALSTLVIPKADIVLDVHSGDGAEWLDAFVGVYGGPLASDYPTALRAAKAFGFPNIVRYKMRTQEQIDRGRSLNRQAVAQGLPTLLVEIGENGKRDEEHIQAILSGVKGVLHELSMLGSEPSTLKAEHDIRLIDGTSSIKSQYSGTWHPRHARGHRLKQGETIGVVRDYSGKILETIKAPKDGFALYGLAGPPVRAGESVLTLGTVVEELN
jgi:predicted deacylase